MAAENRGSFLAELCSRPEGLPLDEFVDNLFSCWQRIQISNVQFRIIEFSMMLLSYIAGIIAFCSSVKILPLPISSGRSTISCIVGAVLFINGTYFLQRAFTKLCNMSAFSCIAQACGISFRKRL
ncbi:hypothetical protein CDAR_19081 [Caerostris darwini]|uniref:Uncharacterized protein n=1 Tax=Caerostris darwini TaxID=1538125 RepID=A0AAV4WDC7_9ARAC|nr:hypothetical protein CDAR_19081 [Caerostris darwini]